MSQAHEIPSAKIWWLEYDYEYANGRAYISYACAVRLDGVRRLEWSGEDALQNLCRGLNNAGAKYVFCWDFPFFGAFLDYAALKAGLPEYKNAKKREGRGRRGPGEECWSALYTAGRGMMNFRLTLARTAKTHDYGGGKIGGLHTVEYRGISVFFQGENRVDVERKFDATGSREDRGLKILAGFFPCMSKMCGEECKTDEFLRSVYTIGGAAKRVYLRIRYGDHAKLSAYHKDHFADERVDDYFRDRRLLLSGMCFFGQAARAVLIESELTKYDVNGLYSATANDVGELSYPRRATWEEFGRDRNPGVTYIVVVRGLEMYRKKDMPPAFTAPFDDYDGDPDHIVISSKFALFRELWDALHQYYIFEEFEVVDVFRLERKDDPAIRKYNDKFVIEKKTAQERGDEVMRSFAKSFLNTLIGKFSQKTKYREILARYNQQTDMVEFDHGAVIDNWGRGHFDFIRGAYIYTCARVRVMGDIARYCAGAGGAVAHHVYTDTDSIVTDMKFPDDAIDDEILGRYKVEERYKAFGVFAKKVYYGRTEAGEDKVTAAGIPRGMVVDEIHDTYGEGLTARETWDVLKLPNAYPVPVVRRVHGGAVYDVMPVKLAEIDVDKM